MCNHTKVLSVLNLTTSDNDHEALAAVRTANLILKKNKLTWNEFFKVPFRPEPPPPPKQKPNETKFDANADVEEMIAYVREHAWPNFNFDFIDSLEASFEKYGSLTDKQFKALENIYNKVKK